MQITPEPTGQPKAATPSLVYTNERFEVRHDERVLETLSLDELITLAGQCEGLRSVLVAGTHWSYSPRQALQVWNNGDLQDLVIRRACQRTGVDYLSLFPARKPLHERVKALALRQPRALGAAAVLLVIAAGLIASHFGSTRPRAIPVAEQIRMHVAVLSEAESSGELTLHVVGPRIAAFDEMKVNIDSLTPRDRKNYDRLRSIVEQWRPHYNAANGHRPGRDT